MTSRGAAAGKCHRQRTPCGIGRRGRPFAGAWRSGSGSAIGQVAVTVADLERTTEFYHDVLGMALLFHAPGMLVLPPTGPNCRKLWLAFFRDLDEHTRALMSEVAAA